MPKNVGRYQQGNSQPARTQGDMNEGSKVPTKRGPAPAPPSNQLPVRDNGHTVGNNDAHKAH